MDGVPYTFPLIEDAKIADPIVERPTANKGLVLREMKQIVRQAKSADVSDLDKPTFTFVKTFCERLVASIWYVTCVNELGVVLALALIIAKVSHSCWKECDLRRFPLLLYLNRGKPYMSNSEDISDSSSTLK